MITEFIIKHVLNYKFGRFGKMLKLEINSDKQSIELEVLPKGESSPITISIGRYEIMTGSENAIKFNNITTSREWMTEVIRAVSPEPIVKFDHAKLLKIIM